MPDFDVVVAGAGPAGCAAALSLATSAPELRVCLAGPLSVAEVRVGETVPPPIAPILAHLNLRERFLADGHCPSYRTLSAWGTPEAVENEFLFGTHHVGWRLDRAKFDMMMCEAAAGRVALYAKTMITNASRDAEFWCAGLADAAPISTRFIIDATGRSAAVARSHRLPIQIEDALVACSIRVEDNGGLSGDLLLETFPDGWWYTAGLPDRRRVIVCMTDSDQVRQLGLRHAKTYMGRLRETRHIKTVGESVILDGPKLWAANTHWVTHRPDVPLLCVGDAACSFDPVAGQGIVNALRSGIFAAYAVVDFLRHADDHGRRRYDSMLGQEVASYYGALREFYSRETRWRMRPFWSRRLTWEHPVT